jgi:hypothetical protein
MIMGCMNGVYDEDLGLFLHDALVESQSDWTFLQNPLKPFDRQQK